MRTAVVLPAPLGPSRPCTVPAGTRRSKQSRAVVAPNRRVNPSASIMPGSLSSIALLLLTVYGERCGEYSLSPYAVKRCDDGGVTTDFSGGGDPRRSIDLLWR